MKAIVKVAYFDDLGLHKVGDVVEVKAINPKFHKAIAPAKEEKPAKVEKPVDEPVTETVEEKPTKKTPKKSTKKPAKKTAKKG